MKITLVHVFHPFLLIILSNFITNRTNANNLQLGFQIQDELDPLFTKSSSTPKSDILLKRDSVIETAARQSVSSHKSLTLVRI